MVLDSFEGDEVFEIMDFRAQNNCRPALLCVSSQYSADKTEAIFCFCYFCSKHSVTSCHKRAQGEVAKTSENACFMSCTREFTDVIEEETEETCNGEMYLNCKLAGSQKSDLDDLADFIVCKPRKEYSSWLKEREKYRSWKGKKETVVRWEKKKKTYRKLMKP